MNEFLNQNLRQIGEGVCEPWSDTQAKRHPDRQTEVAKFIYTRLLGHFAPIIYFNCEQFNKNKTKISRILL